MRKKQDMIKNLIHGLESAESFSEKDDDFDAYHYLAGYVSTVIKLYS